MQVVIFCGGLGTRLREETEFRPKPLVPIGPRPILWHIMKAFAAQGHTDFILALGYKGDMIKHYFMHYEFMCNDVTIELGNPDSCRMQSAHEEAGWKISLVNTGEKSLKGARLKRVERYIEGDVFMATYGDGLANVDINALLDFHRSHGRMATITGVMPANRFGELSIEGNQVTTFQEKPETHSGGFINGGFLVFNREFLNYLYLDDDCDLEYGPLERLAGEGQLMVYRHTGFWACMDTIRDSEYLNRLWNEGKAAWKIW